MIEIFRKVVENEEKYVNFINFVSLWLLLLNYLNIKKK